MSKKYIYLLTVFIFLVVNTGTSQTVKNKLKTIQAVSELTMSKTFALKEYGFSENHYDIAVNLGFDKIYSNNSALGMHIFLNSSMRAGVRGRVSQFNNQRKIFDFSVGITLNRIKKDVPFDFETSFYLSKNFALFARLDVSNYLDVERMYDDIPNGIKKRNLKLGLKFNSVKAIGAAAGVGVILLGIAVLALGNSK